MGKIHDSRPGHVLKMERVLTLESCEESFVCSGCQEEGLGSRYRCERCNYVLHKDCMYDSGRTVEHEFFKNSTFTFLLKPPGNPSCKKCRRYCNACGKRVKGFGFYDEKNGRALHPCCRKLPRKLSVDGVNFSLCAKLSSTCLFCNNKVREGTVSGTRGWGYVSRTENRQFHVSCAAERKMEAWEKGTNYDNEYCLGLEKVKLPIQRYNGNRRSGSKFIRLGKAIVKIIGAILLGDPIMISAVLFEQLAAN